MTIGYKIKKSWHGFWQKYKLKTHLRIASKLLMIFLLVWLIGSVLTIFSQWAYTDNFQGSVMQGKYLKYFWPVIIELVSGYDIDDASLMMNPVSNVLSVIMLITGIIIFAIFTGQIVSMFIQVLQRLNHLPEKPENFRFNRPVVICGINDKLPQIVMELRKSPHTHNREIVVIDEGADTLKIGEKECYKDVWYVKGNQADRAILEKVIGHTATSAIILTPEHHFTTGSSTNTGRYLDSRAIETAMAIEGYEQKTHTVLELMNERNIPHLKHTKINEWISVFDYGVKLVSQAAMQHGMGSVYHYLLGNGKQHDNQHDNQHQTTRIHFTQPCLPECFRGRSYETIRNKIIDCPDLDVTAIGFARHVPPVLEKRYDLNLDQTPFINQLNPVGMVCRKCKKEIEDIDPLGRAALTCPACTGNKEPAYQFPKFTVLNKEDKLIYLAAEPVENWDIGHCKKKRKGTKRTKVK